MFQIVRVKAEEVDKYMEAISKIYSLHNPYVSTGVVKSNVNDFIIDLKDEDLIDDVEELDEAKGFAIDIEDAAKYIAFTDYIKSHLLKGVDWGFINKKLVLFYAFE